MTTGKRLGKLGIVFALVANLSGCMDSAGPPQAPANARPATPAMSMADGTKFAGLSPETARPMYTTAQDAPGTYTWERSMGYCSGLDAYGHKDWRVPTRAELNVLFDHQASLGGFDINGSFFPAGSYWSSTLSQRRDDVAWLHNFQDGHEAWYRKEFAVHLRCVR